MKKKWCVTFCVFVFDSAVTVAATLYVSPSGTNNAAQKYPDWAGAATNIQWAVNAATNGELILVTNSVYLLTNEIFIGTGVTVRSFHDGVPDRTGTVVNGGGICRGFCLSNQNAVIEGFTVTNCKGANYGGGVYIDSTGGGHVTNCIITGCSSTNIGGGVYLYGNKTKMSACLVIGNSSTNGGGGFFGRSGSIILDSAIRDNRAGGEGGGAYIVYGSTIERCTFSNNTSSGRGGGLSLSGASALNNCTIISNISGGSGGGIFAYQIGTSANCSAIGNLSGGGASGGGAYFDYSTAEESILVNWTISGNTAGGWGGGVYARNHSRLRECIVSSNVAAAADGKGGGLYLNDDVTARNCLIASNTAVNGGGIYIYRTSIVENCTISDNLGTTSAGGVYSYGASGFGSGGVLRNTIVYSNAAPANSNWYVTAGHEASFTNCCTTPSVSGYGTNNIITDPLFVNRSIGNYRLAPSSPCINAGANDPWMNTAVDLGGMPRIRYGVVDMGAYEFLCQGTIFSFN